HILQQILQIHLAGLVGQQNGRNPPPVLLPQVAHGITIAPHRGSDLAVGVGVSGRIRLHWPSLGMGMRGGGASVGNRRAGKLAPYLLSSAALPGFPSRRPPQPRPRAPTPCHPTIRKPEGATAGERRAAPGFAIRTRNLPRCLWGITWTRFGPGRSSP